MLESNEAELRLALAEGLLPGEEVDALREEAARAHLEAAWATGFHEPRVAYALALVLGRRYQHERLEADRIRMPPNARRSSGRPRSTLATPALDVLKRSQGEELPEPEYAEALRAFHEACFEETLKALGSRLPCRTAFSNNPRKVLEFWEPTGLRQPRSHG